MTMPDEDTALIRFFYLSLRPILNCHAKRCAFQDLCILSNDYELPSALVFFVALLIFLLIQLDNLLPHPAPV